MVLIFISLIIRDIEHFFMCFLVICRSSMEKCLFRLSVYYLCFDAGFFFFNFCCEVFVLFLCNKEVGWPSFFIPRDNF